MYDPDGNLLSAANAAGTLVMGYDADGRMTSRTDPSGVTLTFHYDGDGRATLVTDSLGATEAVGYDAAGSLVAASLSTRPGRSRPLL
ncbi:RHS repeat domain-containing protein [Fimbriiglobus ruber]|uniref:Flagellar hook protein FlgE n=1 Tax=Fimbriiglobus ruber TaxID=1908690 RepID=A0A225DJY0_9BACT|nr:RHS repeat domain-containing protein [Fimbriiglobus ruber]OWK41283.1 Flagellar hook protein FlgE [Fimbriiglobus ruber]